jgi:hypothetical protein
MTGETKLTGKHILKNYLTPAALLQEAIAD